MHDDTILQANKLKINLECEQRFNVNMLALKKYLPELHRFYFNYKPKEFTLAFDDAGELNLVNPDGRYVYPESPKIYADKQYEKYRFRPAVLHLTFADHEELIDGYVHQKLMRELFELYDDVAQKMINIRPRLPQQLQTMVVMGVGMGFHIEKVLKEHDVRNLCLYDAHPDSFYMALHCINWVPIFERYSQAGYNLELCFGKSALDSYNQLSVFFSSIGMSNIVVTYLYEHYQSKDINELVALFRKDLLKIAQGIGFYDDERVGVAHTINNYENRIPIARKSLLVRGDISSTVAIVVGSGPSLDSNENFLRENSDNAIIISCGTSLAVLEKKGIKPDIHVEQERNLNQYDWIINSTSEGFRKGIRLVALNTVHPKVFELFDEAYVVPKPNDLGSTLLVELMERNSTNSMALADYGNPTVTNFGASLAALLGYKNIVLLGVDLGMSSIDRHHSEDSEYYNRNISWEDETKAAGYFKTKGNFQEEVWTTSTFDKSRISFEMLINKYRLNCINVNDGIRIKNAISCHSDQIKIDVQPAKDLGKELYDRLQKVFYLDGMAPFHREIMDSHIAHVRVLLDAYLIALDNDIRSLRDLYDSIRLIHYTIQKNPRISFVAKGLLKGTIEYINCTMISILCAEVNEESFVTIFGKMKEIINRYCDEIERDVSTKFYKLDKFSNYYNNSK